MEENRKSRGEAITPLVIVIADDHPFVVDFLERFCSRRWPNAKIVRCLNFTHVVDFVETTYTDLLIMDYVMPGMGALEAVEKVLQLQPDVRVVVFSGMVSTSDAAEVLGAGASAYASKSMGVEGLERVVDLVTFGETYAPASIVKEMLYQLRSYENSEDTDLQERGQLSDREIGVLQKLAAGNSNKVIAGQIGISESSVKQLLRKIFKKLGVKNRAQAVAEALRLSLVEMSAES